MKDPTTYHKSNMIRIYFSGYVGFTVWLNYRCYQYLINKNHTIDVNHRIAAYAKYY
jgi:hypothetical protein